MLKKVKHQRNARRDGIAPTPTDAILESISDGVFIVATNKDLAEQTRNGAIERAFILCTRGTSVSDICLRS